jgi:hypothetical protein
VQLSVDILGRSFGGQAQHSYSTAVLEAKLQKKEEPKLFFFLMRAPLNLFPTY